MLGPLQERNSPVDCPLERPVTWPISPHFAQCYITMLYIDTLLFSVRYLGVTILSI